MRSVYPFLRAPALAAAVLVLTVSGCTSTGGTKTGVSQYASLMSEAEAQVGAGAIDSAIRTFDLAAQADPTQKDPWVRSAQLQFDAGSYGRAIVAAQEALQRDPGDLVADSVLTLGGFRVAGESLKRLQAGGALSSESARSEAKQLAESMRSIMGDEIVDIAKPTPAPRSTRRSSRRSATPAPKPAPAPAPKPASGDPFNKLGGN